MCKFCSIASGSVSYKGMLSTMYSQDQSRMKGTIVASQTLKLLERTCYSTIEWPVSLCYPVFETRAAFAVPNNYFQNLLIDHERLGNSFAHGASRGIFFAGNRLMLFSKSTNMQASGGEFFTNFILAHFEKDEYSAKIENNEITIAANIEKKMKNLVTGKPETKKIVFNFVHKSVKGRIVSKDQVATSAAFRDVYQKYGKLDFKTSSIDLEGYAITVPHFAPHPFMLQLHSEFGFKTNREFQENVEEYFRAHI